MSIPQDVARLRGPISEAPGGWAWGARRVPLRRSMGLEDAEIRDRRLDARVAPAGRVRVAPPPPRPPASGRLVDVSAGGLRVALGEQNLDAGAAVRVEIHLDDPAYPRGPARLILDGQGRVVWVRDLAGEREAGVKFDRPVEVRPSFPDMVVF